MIYPAGVVFVSPGTGVAPDAQDAVTLGPAFIPQPAVKVTTKPAGPRILPASEQHIAVLPATPADVINSQLDLGLRPAAALAVPAVVVKGLFPQLCLATARCLFGYLRMVFVPLGSPRNNSLTVVLVPLAVIRSLGCFADSHIGIQQGGRMFNFHTLHTLCGKVEKLREQETRRIDRQLKAQAKGVRLCWFKRAHRRRASALP